MPVISVDTKSRELIGPFHQPGRAWTQQPVAVLDHDFPSDANDAAIPYGIYDFGRNEGFVNLGVNAGVKVYQNHRVKSLPPGCLDIPVRLGAIQRP